MVVLRSIPRTLFFVDWLVLVAMEFDEEVLEVSYLPVRVPCATVAPQEFTTQSVSKNETVRFITEFLL